MIIRKTMLALAGVLALTACSGSNDRAYLVKSTASQADLHANETPELRASIEHWSKHYGVPVELVQKVVIRESRHRPEARNGPYYGLMQILPQTARTMGFQGPDAGLLDADTNLRYGVKYLRGAWMVSDGDLDTAVGWYARGYYYEAKRRGLLEATGLRG
ncbi:lytic transglycosylase domain-containing protein [Paracoccus sp. TK19116]|uniref:Lytic transglycosylase domain-containing protein n=1 Tax=Paracoccus albicereus TaxID=2922394 RepID=A0ABT1MRG6_9RHOB|nr:lytic transglycosylase domain-containing protein [Paracoccus albicereus]MCQ0970309.1 lytic transglycosylase domain-containing protein [Paracoccus albicereus]